MEIIDNQYLKKWLCIPNYKRRMKKLFEGISLTGYSISLIPSKLLTSTVPPNFDFDNIFKNCRSFMVQYRQPLSKAFQSEISFAMHGYNSEGTVMLKPPDKSV
jgi:hypothetical protein